MSALVSVRELVRPVTPFSAADTIATAAERFLSPLYEQILSIPVIDNERPVGTLSRHQLNEIFLRRFGRDLFGVRRVAEFMSTQPLIVDVGQPLNQTAAYVTMHMRFPVTEDFVVVDGGRHLGVGAVLDLLGAMQRQAHETALRLTRTLQILRAQQAQLIQSEKMATLGRCCWNASPPPPSRMPPSAPCPAASATTCSGCAPEPSSARAIRPRPRIDAALDHRPIRLAPAAPQLQRGHSNPARVRVTNGTVLDSPQAVGPIEPFQSRRGVAFMR